MKIYLAGGFRSNWQERVKNHLKGKFILYNPREKEYSGSERFPMSLNEYGSWDLHHIKMSDIVFIYVERTNPGVAHLIEASYAKGLGKTVILVLEPNNKHIEDRYLEFIKLISDVAFDNIEDGLNFLYTFK